METTKKNEAAIKRISYRQLKHAEGLILQLKKDTRTPLSRIQQNIVKNLGYGTTEIYGDWNGYGRERLGKRVNFLENNFDDFMSLLKKYIQKNKKTAKKQQEPKPALTEEEIIAKWAKRLANLSGISVEEAIQIGEEKINAKFDLVEKMKSRQDGSYSVKRNKLINKMERANPLRRIMDTQHAYAIIQASNRHKYSNYESQLDEGRELAAIGVIDKSEVKNYAHEHMRYN